MFHFLVLCHEYVQNKHGIIKAMPNNRRDTVKLFDKVFCSLLQIEINFSIFPIAFVEAIAGIKSFTTISLNKTLLNYEQERYTQLPRENNTGHKSNNSFTI